KSYFVRTGLFGTRRRALQAVRGVSFEIPRGQTYALVGESGSGKTTTSNMVLRLLPPSTGSVRWEGQDVWSLRGPALRQFQTSVQAVFQDPWSSMNPRWRIRDVIAEPLRLSRRPSRAEVNVAVTTALRSVELHEEDAEKYPHQFSGGQRQRIA